MMQVIRYDIKIDEYNMVIEVKCTRKSMTERNLTEELGSDVFHLGDIFDLAKQKLNGHYQYYGITDNSYMISQFYLEIKKALFKWLNRRSQRRSSDLDKFKMYMKYNPLHKPKIYVNVYR